MFSNKEDFKKQLLQRLEMMCGKSFAESPKRINMKHLGNMIREYISKNWIKTNELYRLKMKQVYYLSIEFLLGRFGDNLLNLGIEKVVAEGLRI